MKQDKRCNSLVCGLVPGIMVPVLALVAIWLLRHQGGFFAFLKAFQQHGVLARLLSLAAIPNLGIFFLFIWTNRTFSARGVIFATLAIALVMVVLKFA